MIAAGLPLGLLDDSVRVTARGAIAAAATVVLEASGADAALPDAVPTALRDARRAAALADGELERLRRELEVIESAPLVVEPSDRQPPVDWVTVTAARRAFLELRQARLRELRHALTGAAAHAQECARALAAATDAEKRRSTARSPRNAELRKSIVIDLEPAGAAEAGGEPGGEIELFLEYAVRGARWAPSYVARHEAGKLTWTMRAQVAQQTGEDWRGVTLRLSTAALDGHSELPELAALKIGKRQTPAPGRLRPPPPGVEELFADFDRDLTRGSGGSDGSGRVGEARIAGEPVPDRPRPAKEQREDQARTVPLGPFGVATNVFAEGAYQAAPAQTLLGGSVSEPMAAERRSSRDDDTQVHARSKKARLPNLKMSGSRGAPPAPGMARPSMSMDMDEAMSTLSRSGAGGKPMAGYGGAPGAPPMDARYAPPEPTALFDYVGLVMAGFGHPRRGTLVAMSLVERYRASDDLDTDLVRRRLQKAQEAAQRLEQAAMPSGFSDDWGHDFDYAIEAEARVDVLSDGGWHSLPLCTRSAPAKVTHVAVPREAPEVFRTATGDNPFEIPILPGPVDVYDGDRFLVTAEAPVAPPGGQLILPLGVDASIKVARNTDFREEVTGMLRGGLRLVHELRFEVQNTSAAPIELEVRERVPVPRQRDSDDITVEVTAAQPAWQPWTPPPTSAHQPEMRGGYRWQLSVAPRTTAKLSATYEVRIAGKHELVGGNRRES